MPESGQLLSISGTINQTTESAAYTYDDLGRLATSNQTSNGSSAQRRFAYDRWGNRTAEWDSVGGGTQIQSITLQQSGGAPTNRIQSVTSGSTVNYSYDAAGNLTNDGAHTYTYDAENRIVTVDGGSTATYAYDQSNQRYKKAIGATVTHYIWQGSQVIAEHNGGTGASTADYVYSGSRMIAKIAGLTTQYFVNDRLSARLTLNTSANVIGRQGHLPFGEDLGESGTQEKHHFTSYELDSETGLDYAISRSHSRNLGRFQQADPYRASGGSNNPQSWNRYSYTRNDPVNRADPLGMQDIDSDMLWDWCGYGDAFPANLPLQPLPETIPIEKEPTIGDEARERLSAFLGKFPKCGQKLDTLSRSNSGFSVEETATMTNFVNYTDYTDPFETFFQAHLVDEHDPDADRPIRGRFEPLQPDDPNSESIAGAWTSPITNVVILGWSYLRRGDQPDRQAAVIAHEMLHRAGLSHQDMADQLGVHYDTHSFDPENAASMAVTDWIAQGCPD